MVSANDAAARVELSIPMRAEYVSIARLTAAGVANRLGFDIETIEDIKVSLSEVCNRIIGVIGGLPGGGADGGNLPEGGAGGGVNGGVDGGGIGADCKIEFVLSDDNLGINFYVSGMESYDFLAPNSSASGTGGTVGAGIGSDVRGASGASGASGAGSISDSSGGDKNIIDEDRRNDDRHMEENYQDQLQLSLITLLMDEFVVNPHDKCLVAMKKYLG